MPTNRNALVRYHTIDKCLQNRYRKWTLSDLIDACSDALYEYEGIDKPVGRRTIQTDIQLMRSNKLGYNAPIVVRQKKYYAYEDPDYSITNSPLTNSDLASMAEAVEILKQFKGFSQFEEIGASVKKLEDKIYATRNKRPPIVEFEKNENLKGLEFLDLIYQAINKEQVLSVTYQSFTAKKPQTFSFHPYLLKEYRNRWFVLGYKEEKQPDYTIALDRIVHLETNQERYLRSSTFNPQEYYQEVVGVTVNKGVPLQEVRLFVHKISAPYILTKPLHPSQQVVEQSEEGTILTLQVRPNIELERLILSYGANIVVLAPEKLKNHILKKINNAFEAYEKVAKKGEI